jgi:hypothetical protein
VKDRVAQGERAIALLRRCVTALDYELVSNAMRSPGQPHVSLSVPVLNDAEAFLKELEARSTPPGN